MEVRRNEHFHYRGLHVVVINPANGKVVTARAFDTYQWRRSFDDFIAEEIPNGHIVVAACKDDCITNMSQAGKQWFADMGSS